ncbi:MULTISPECIES: choice-of-anchor Q domain-containing protein [unclassified Carboxylicivirga]|uniref:choice-of-anchor Q domain-containing protein n=1 Tax=Carboxylicivirga TaxID=1628153 RepID=UPI003D35165B
MKQFQLLLLSLFFAASTVSLAQTTWYVNGASGDNGNDGQSESSAFATIYHAVDQSSDNDLIKVAAGTYTHPNILINKSITIKGVDNDANAVIIQAQANEPDYIGTGAESNKRIISLGASAEVTIKNMTLRYGNSTTAGGAIAVYAGQSITIDHCNLLNCYSGANGGAIISWGSINITNSCIANNVSGGLKGAAIFGQSSNDTQLNDITISNSVIYNNSVTGSNKDQGAAIFSENADATRGTITMNSSTLAYTKIINPANNPMAVGIRFIKGKSLTLTNSILFNSLENKWGTGLDIGGTDSKVFEITERGINHHNIISNAYATAIGTDCIAGESATEAAISFGTFRKGANGVYTLPLLAGSVAIDAADATTAVSTDILGTSRGSAPDMGSFEYTTATTVQREAMEVSITPNPNNGAFKVKIANSDNSLLEVFALSGQKLYSSQLVAGTNSIVLPSDIKGIVLVKLIANGQTCTRKMLIR